MIRWIKKLLGIYEPDHEYWIHTKDIKVPLKYKCHRIGEEKWKRKLNHWYMTGEFESPILLRKDFTLVDGYSSMKIAHINGIEKVPVRFVE